MAAAQSAMLPLVVFALFLGFALTRIAPARRALLLEFFQAIADAMIVVVRWVLWAAPLGVFALILAVCARSGLGMLSALGVYVLVECLLYLAVTAMLLPVAMRLGRRKVASLRRRAGARAGGGGQHAVVAGFAAGDAGECRSPARLIPNRSPRWCCRWRSRLFRLTSPVQYVTSAAFIAWAYGIDLSQRATAWPARCWRW